MGLVSCCQIYMELLFNFQGRKKHFLEGWSIRELSRQLKISRQTVRKMLEDGEVPKYNRKQPKLSPVMDPYREIIEEMLKVDESAPLKQKHTAARIHERLQGEHGFKGGESTVRRYVRSLKKVKAECFLMLEAGPGEHMQIDFGEAQVYIKDKPVKAMLFCMSLKYSSVPFVIAFPTQRLEASGMLIKPFENYRFVLGQSMRFSNDFR